MQTAIMRITLLVAIWMSASMVRAKTVYLVMPGTPGVTPTAPYTNGWACASTNLYGIMTYTHPDYSVKANDVLLISNGVYAVTNMIYPGCQGALIQSVSTNPADVVITPGPGHSASTPLFYLNAGLADRTTWVGLTFSNSTYRALETYGGTNITVRNCVFTDNRGAVNGGAIGTMFPGVASVGLQLLDCVFRNNGWGSGGAVTCWGATIISNCLFVGNNATGSGAPGALYIVSSTIATRVEDCMFINNTHFYTNNPAPGGAGYNVGPLRMTRCSFVSNSCTGGQGGGWFIGNTNTVISDCRFIFSFRQQHHELPKFRELCRSRLPTGERFALHRFRHEPAVDGHGR